MTFPAIQPVKFTLSLTAGQRLPIGRVGNFVRCVEAADVFTIAPNEGDETEMQSGIGVDFGRLFEYVVIVNGPTAQTIELYIGQGRVDDSRLYGSINTLDQAFPAADLPADESIDDGETDTIAADLDQAIVIVQADVNNTGDLRVGPDAAAGRGFVLTPGAQQPYRLTRAINIHNESGVNGLVYRYYRELIS